MKLDQLETGQKNDFISIINVYKKNSGTTNVALMYLKAFKEINAKSELIQCTEGDDSDYVSDTATLLRGLRVPLTPMRIFMNRVLIFPRLVKWRYNHTLIFDPTMIFSGDKSKSVIYVHDLRALSAFEEKFGEYLFYLVIKVKLKNFRKILVNSNFTRTVLMNIGISEERIKVIYPYVDINNIGSHLALTLEKINDGLMLNVVYVANDLPYKNIAFFLSVAEYFDNRYPNLFKFELVSKITSDTESSILKLGLKNLKVTRCVDDISDVYTQSDIVLFPSKYEGFGLPMAEAICFGLPVIANTIPTAYEILGDSGLIIDVQNFDKWVQALLLLRNKDRYLHYANKAIEKRAFFSKERFVEDVRTLVGEKWFVE